MKNLVYILILVFTLSCASSQAQNYTTHKVRKGETIEGIAKQYKVSKSAIYALNPDARKKLKLSSVLIIPKSNTVAQDPKVVVTKELKGFKKHRVKRKETLFSLAKQYKVTQDEIKKHNKFLYAENLRRGDKLQIPIFRVIRKMETPKATSKTYVVKPKEGKWRIAYKFGITVTELEELNPNMSAVLQPGQRINVPNIEKNEVKEIDEKYSYYTVLPREGFYRLKLKTGLQQEELEKLNPGLKASGLKVGMILKVPFKKESESITDNTNSTGVDSDGAISNLANYNLDRSVKHIAVMLPFKLHKVDTDSIADTKNLILRDRTLGVALDFHSGVLMALDSLKKLGVNLKVDVYDTKSMQSEVSSILRRNEFNDTDVVIGPLMPKNFNLVASNLKQEGVSVVSPITKKVELGSNVFQTRPSDLMLKQKVIAHFKADSSAHIVIISDLKNKATCDMLKREFPLASLVKSRTDSKTKKDAYYILDQDVIDALRPGKNVVFLETKHSGFVSNVTSSLNSKISDDIQVVLTTTIKNKAFEGDEVSNYHLSNLQFTFPSVSKMVDIEAKNSFVEKYKLEYGVTPNTYAVRGFDVTMDVVLRLVTSEDLGQSVNDTPLTSYVESKFAYKKKLFGGYYNSTVYLVKYQELKIVEVE